jgi:hypothetical protein
MAPKRKRKAPAEEPPPSSGSSSNAGDVKQPTPAPSKKVHSQLTDVAIIQTRKYEMTYRLQAHLTFCFRTNFPTYHESPQLTVTATEEEYHISRGIRLFILEFIGLSSDLHELLGEYTNGTCTTSAFLDVTTYPNISATEKYTVRELVYDHKQPVNWTSSAIVMVLLFAVTYYGVQHDHAFRKGRKTHEWIQHALNNIAVCRFEEHGRFNLEREPWGMSPKIVGHRNCRKLGDVLRRMRQLGFCLWEGEELCDTFEQTHRDLSAPKPSVSEWKRENETYRYHVGAVVPRGKRDLLSLLKKAVQADPDGSTIPVVDTSHPFLARVWQDFERGYSTEPYPPLIPDVAEDL